MRIVCITSSFPRRPGDIAGRFVQEFCEVLISAGHDVSVFTWQEREPSSHAPGGLSVVRVPYAPRRWQNLFYGEGAPENLEENPWRALLGLPALATMSAAVLPAARSADLVVGHWLVPGGLVARLCGALSGTPSLVVGHSGGVHLLQTLPDPAGRALAELVASGPITVPTGALAAKLRSLSARATPHVLPMGFVPPVEVEVQRDGSAWLFMGRLVWIKGFDVAIEALGRSRHGSRSRLHVAGRGAEQEELKRSVDTRDLDARFHGFVSGSLKAGLLYGCRFSAFPSRILPSGRHEGLPVSLLECMYAGCVPLVSDFPGVREYLPRPDLQVVRKNSPEAWSEAMDSLMEMSVDAVEELAAQCRQAAERFTWENLADYWYGVVRRAAAMSSHASLR